MTTFFILSTIALGLFIAAYRRNEMSLVIFGALVTCLAFGSLIGG